MLKLSLLLADSLSLSSQYVNFVFENLVEINKDGTSILRVEQNCLKALEICYREYVFDIGTIALGGNFGLASQRRASREDISWRICVFMLFLPKSERILALKQLRF